MRSLLSGLVLTCFMLVGCKGNTSAPENKRPGEPPVKIDLGALKPLPINNGTAEVTAEDVVLRFRGRKADGHHDGGFQDIKGKLTVNDQQELTGVELEIQTKSLWSDNPKLTGHLKNADFFDVREHPTATFTSTDIEPTDAEAGTHTITGNLTLHGETKELEIPATVQITEEGITVESQFTFDRTEFGMNYRPEEIDKEVSVAVTIGQSIAGNNPLATFQSRDEDGNGILEGDEIPEELRGRLASLDKDQDGGISPEELQYGTEGAPTGGGAVAPGPGGPGGPGGPRGGGPGGPGGGRRFDPAAFFERLDENDDGKLSGEEIPERMKERLDTIDTDKDGAVTLEEFQQGFRRRGGGGPGGPGGGPGGGGGSGRPKRPM